MIRVSKPTVSSHQSFVRLKPKCMDIYVVRKEEGGSQSEPLPIEGVLKNIHVH